jgi:hypothetical protein
LAIDFAGVSSARHSTEGTITGDKFPVLKDQRPAEWPERFRWPPMGRLGNVLFKNVKTIKIQ